ncbi:MAG: hypothetical protein ABJG15_09535 [Hyphomonadaceae bacterium]
MQIKNYSCLGAVFLKAPPRDNNKLDRFGIFGPHGTDLGNAHCGTNITQSGAPSTDPDELVYTVLTKALLMQILDACAREIDGVNAENLKNISFDSRLTAVADLFCVKILSRFGHDFGKTAPKILPATSPFTHSSG